MDGIGMAISSHRFSKTTIGDNNHIQCISHPCSVPKRKKATQPTGRHIKLSFVEQQLLVLLPRDPVSFRYPPPTRSCPFPPGMARFLCKILFQQNNMFQQFVENNIFHILFFILFILFILFYYYLLFFLVLEKGPCGPKVLERYVSKSSSSMKAEKERQDHEVSHILIL